MNRKCASRLPPVWLPAGTHWALGALDAMGKKGKGSTRLPSGSSSGALGGLSPLQDRLLQQRVQAFCKVHLHTRCLVLMSC